MNYLFQLVSLYMELCLLKVYVAKSQPLSLSANGYM